MRRDLGPIAWCALECLVEQADAAGGVEASVRSVAEDLGVAKNTAHRALRALADGGLVVAEQRRASDGRFRAGRYRLRLDDLAATDPEPEPAPRTRTRRRLQPVDDGQLTLLPPA